MQILFFIIAVGMTGIAGMYNLCNGYIDEATWLSFGLTLLFLLAWFLWIFVVIAKSSRIKAVLTGIDILFLGVACGVIYYGFSAGFSSALLKGLGLAFGTIFVLPLAGFSKIFGGAELSPYLAVIPYVLLVVLSWIITRFVIKTGMARRHLQKENEKALKKMKKKEGKKASKAGKNHPMQQEEIEKNQNDDVMVPDESPEGKSQKAEIQEADEDIIHIIDDENPEGADNSAKIPDEESQESEQAESDDEIIHIVNEEENQEDINSDVEDSEPDRDEKNESYEDEIQIIK